MTDKGIRSWGKWPDFPVEQNYKSHHECALSPVGTHPDISSVAIILSDVVLVADIVVCSHYKISFFFSLGLQFIREFPRCPQYPRTPIVA